MAMWIRFSPRGTVKGYLNGRKRWWKRAAAKARRRWAGKDTKAIE